MMKCPTFGFQPLILIGFLLSSTFLFAQPANDNACNAIALTIGTTCSSDIYTNVAATMETDEPNPNCYFGSDLNTVWFTFDGPASGRVSIDGVAGTLSNANIQFALYTASNCGDLTTFTEVFCTNRADDEIIDVTTGTTYYLQVDGQFTNMGTFCIQVLDCPAQSNDDPCNATPITLGTTCPSAIYSIECALPQTNEPDPGCFFGNDLNSVWFTFVAPSSGQVTIDGIGGTLSNANIQVAVYSVTNCSDFNTFSEIFCDNVADDEILGGLTPTETYYVQVDGQFNTLGTFCLEIFDCPAPTNDDVCNATPITVGTTCTGAIYSNECALSETNESDPNCFFGSDLNSVWFSFMAPASGSVSIDGIGGSLSNANIQLAIYSATTCTDFNTFTEILCTARADGEILSNLVPSETYFVQVDGQFAEVGTFCLEIMDCPAPSNDDVCNATPITVGATCTGAIYSNECALSETNEPDPNCFFGNDMNTVWFSFVAPTSGRVTIDGIGGTINNIDIQLAIYSATSCGDFNTFTEVFCTNRADDEIVADLIPNDTYFVQMDGQFFTLGTFCLEIFDCPAPPNDDVCNAIDLPANAACINNPYSNFCADSEIGEPEGSCFFGSDLNSLWFKFTATADGAFITADIAPIGSIGNNNLQIALYSATDCANFGSFSEITCNQDNPPEFDQAGLTQGTTYYIQADGEFFNRGDFCLEIWTADLTCPPNLTAQCNISEQPAYANLAAFEAAGGLSVSNNTIITNSFQMVSETSDGMTCPETVSRVYSITDGKNYTSTCTHIITVDDTIDPVLANTPSATLNFSCASEVPAAANPTASDNCDDNVDIAFNENNQVGSCVDNFTLSRTWTATDDCGNTDIFVQTITVNDATIPSITCPASGIIVDCSSTLPGSDLTSFQNDGGSFSDNCGINLASFQLLSQVGNPNACPGNITRTYQIADNCNNTNTCEQIISIEDQGFCDGINLIVNDNPIPFEQYRASGTITAAGVVGAGTNVEFKAGDTVTLNANFEVILGGTLTIDIEPCNN